MPSEGARSPRAEVEAALPDMKRDVLERIIGDSKITTPVFVCFEELLLANCRNLRRLVDAVGARALYSLKALALPAILPPMASILDGFSASSLFEARIAADCGRAGRSIHLTTPALRPHEIPQLSELCDTITLNSLGELKRHVKTLAPKVELGLRVNPGLSFVSDARYDPCAPRSRLGVALDDAESFLDENRQLATSIRGLHFHTNCESEDFDQLRQTAARIVPLLRQRGAAIGWINLGGGYYLPEEGVPEGLRAAVDLLRGVNPALELYLEPGTAIAQDAAAIVTTALDIIERGPVPSVILDTTINHLPEVFEYRYAPEVYLANESGKFRYMLTGSSCLAGDVFGEYGFDRRLEVGDRICFLDVGSYSLVKANMFNGIPMPSLCHVRTDGSRETVSGPAYETWANAYASS
jgi:carboxynorspermidine decarboxylase